ncbi:MAG TPA: 5'-3' exonuclease H3TH domain-containing protein [Mycobacteriales bacterium]|nr:5'-3' exonuclease H3TH domain-containing protein [Mycobacteriales bacterium]
MPDILLAVDGNSLVHRAFHALAGSNLRTADARPIWAVKGFCSQVFGALERVGARALVVGFDDRGASVRKERWPHYKATRKPKPPELGDQLGSTVDLLRAAGVHVVVPAGLEADDVLASAARTAADAGWQTVVLTSDRDSFALIDSSTSVLRLINGGVSASPMLTPERLVTLCGVRPEQYREYAAMRGDTSDNLAGMMGIGEKTAARLLAEFGTVQAAYDDVDAGGAAVATALGRACVGKLLDAENRSAFARNVEIMTMRADLALGLDLAGGGTGCLPLDAARVGDALRSLELHTIRTTALRVLTDEPAPETPVRLPAAVPVPVPVPAGPTWTTDTLF